ncbi:unnamed protein product, partial [Mesorhabditis spiculigera]
MVICVVHLVEATLGLYGETGAFVIGCPYTFPGQAVYCHLRDYSAMSEKYPGYGWVYI